MKKKVLIIFFLFLPFLLLISSCSKEWLEAKPDKSLIIPERVEDLQALLDNTLFYINIPGGLGEMASGDFFISFTSWSSLYSVQERSAYIWAGTQDFYQGEISADWSGGYSVILNANIALHHIERIKVEKSEQESWNDIKGSALFYRAFSLFSLAQEFCVVYSTDASNNLGLPLRLSYDVNIQVKRSTLQETYDQIITDLKSAEILLSNQQTYKTRPSKAAVYALLARVYLSMENYANAGKYADLAIQLQPDLINYSTLNTSVAYPVTRLNAEVILHSTFSYGIFGAARLIVEPELYNQYAVDDYRKTVFFAKNANGVTFKGSYSGNKNLFCGLTTGEQYLIRAEAFARAGSLSSALADLNILRRSRWKTNYVDLKGIDATTVLTYILQERRRELAFRGIRWSDLRRLNRDSRFAVTLTRNLNEQTFNLLPNDKRYVFPIDEEEIRLSGIQQNER